MANTDNSFWIRIQQGLRETERMMAQKQYNMSMIKARQTLEYMVNYLGEKALIVEGDLADSIDQLYEGKVISQSSKDHFHRIRVLGNKAVHEGDDSPYDANIACQLLSREVNELSGSGKKHSNSSDYSNHDNDNNNYNNRRSNAQTSRQRSQDASMVNMTSKKQSHGERQPSRRKPGTAAPSGRPPQRTGQRSSQRPSTRGRSRRRSRRKGSEAASLMIPALIFVFLLVIVLIFVKLVPGKNDTLETTPPVTSTELVTEAETPVETTEETTEAETEPPKVYTTKVKLNVRKDPSTSSTKLGSLAADSILDYVDTYDDKWTIIMFEGQKAYVASEYVTISEGEDTEESSTTSQ